MKCAVVVIFERSGHYPFIEEKDSFWQTMVHFLTPRQAAQTGVR